MPNLLALTFTSLIAVTAACGQPQTPPQFETASVRLNTADDHIVTINAGSGGRFDARGYTLVLLMQRAYGVMGWNVAGGPAWIRTDRFDVSAKTAIPGSLTEAQLQPRLQRLLEDRFKLKIHRSSNEMSGFALTIAKGGPKLKVSAATEEQPDTFRMGGAGLSGQGISMNDLARFVAGKLGFVAVDETGLKGLYDLNIEWKMGNDARTTVFAALEDQLGLKFVAKTITVPMIVIDSVEKPADN